VSFTTAAARNLAGDFFNSQFLPWVPPRGASGNAPS